MSAPLTPSDLFAQCPQSGVLTGVLFGPESTGLTTDELRLCHRWIRIPTSPHFPSLNLAQAATLVLYEHWSHYANLPAVDERTSAGADIDAREAFLERLEQAIRARDVFPDALVPVRVSQARRLLHRAKPTAGDLALLDHLVAALRDKGRRRQ
jgi:tRNA C32,U32 (ribose-2'-O)-methylase TrmJ